MSSVKASSLGPGQGGSGSSLGMFNVYQVVMKMCVDFACVSVMMCLMRYPWQNVLKGYETRELSSFCIWCFMDGFKSNKLALKDIHGCAVGDSQRGWVSMV